MGGIYTALYALLTVHLFVCHCRLWLTTQKEASRSERYEIVVVVVVVVVAAVSPVSIQTQSLALHALRKRKPQETQALALNVRSKQWQP